MPFHGVRPERQYLFNPTPVTDIAVNDVNAWRLNSNHRHIYNKLHVALSQGLNAAPCGVNPLLSGLNADDPCFVKPITNLGGMSLNTFSTSAQALSQSTLHLPENKAGNCAAGSFWCEFLEGPQTSSDVLIHDGQPVWYAHTRAASEKNRNRPIYWEIGADCEHLEPAIERFVQREMVSYTGLCNVEMIGESIIEVHLRGSNAFFDYYCAGFMAAWVNLVDNDSWEGLEPIKQGCLYSMFGDWSLPDNTETLVEARGARLYRDGMMADRVGIIFAEQPASAGEIELMLRNRSQDQ
uniref:Uncharacterized protein n=1 Tax=uncultured Thiotrichaceae bacterium TaxID=298394 RepID=A0A6S6T878_9GAMM|nr:MAG: Unknown protein [uncultured Thiotrichaceae bacterium]